MSLYQSILFIICCNMVNTFRRLLIFIFLVMLFNKSLAQEQYDHIADWPRLFFSNINLISEASELTSIRHSPKIKFSSAFRYNDYYHGKIEPGIDRIIFSWILTHDFEFLLNILNSNLLIGAHYQSYEKKIDYEFNASESFRIITRGKSYSLSVGSQPWPEYVDIEIRVGKKNLGSEVHFPYSMGLGFKLKNYFYLRYDKYINYFAWDYQIQFRQPAIELYTPEKSNLDQVLFSALIFPRLEFKAMLQVNTLNDRNGFDKSRTTLILSGDQYLRWLSISFKSEPKMEWSINYRNWLTDTDGYFYDQGQVFGKFTKWQEFSESFSPEFWYSWPKQRLGFHLDWGKGEIVDRGLVESWPFTPVWIDLMGLRYSFNSRLTYHFIRFGSKYSYFFPTWQVGIDLCAESISPTGEARTWEPELIGIGIKNLTVYQLAEKKGDGVYVGINLSKKIHRFLQVTYQFNQYIPVDFSRIAKGKQGRVSADKKQYGGGRHSIELILFL